MGDMGDGEEGEKGTGQKETMPHLLASTSFCGKTTGSFLPQLTLPRAKIAEQGVVSEEGSRGSTGKSLRRRQRAPDARVHPWSGLNSAPARTRPGQLYQQSRGRSNNESISAHPRSPPHESPVISHQSPVPPPFSLLQFTTVL